MESRLPSPTPPARSALRSPAAVTALVIVGAWVIAAGTAPGTFAHGYASFVGTFIPAVLVVVAWHEGGHLAASRALGFETVAVTIGPLLFQRARRGWRVRSVSGWPRAGGSISCLPTRQRTVRRDWILMVAAGPVASILLPAVAFALWFGLVAVVPPATSAGGPWARIAGAVLTLAATASGLSFALGILNLVPMRVGGVLSDGAQLRLLAGGGAEAARQLALTMLLGAARRGVRPCEWRDDWVAAATAPAAAGSRRARFATHESFGWCMRYYQALDRGDVAGAAGALDRALTLAAGMAPAQRAVLYLDAAYFEARLRGSAGAARAYLHAARGPEVPGFAILKAQAALMVLEGDGATAAALAEAGLRALAEAEEAQNIRLPMEEELLRELVAVAAGPRVRAELRAPVAAP